MGEGMKVQGRWEGSDLVLGEVNIKENNNL